MKLFESRTDKLIAIIVSGFIFCFGIIGILLKGYFLGLWCAGIGAVGLFFSIKKFKSDPVIIEFKVDGVILPFKGKAKFFNYDEIIKVESIKSLLGNDSPGNAIKLYLKNESEPLKVSFPVISKIDEGEIIRMIRQRINENKS